MTDSILDSTKRTLNLAPDYTPFDETVILYINAVFSTLNQLGIGPDAGFMIQDNTALWSSYLEGDLRLNNVKAYMYLRVRLLFDPPTTSYHVDALNAQVEELAWRINVQRESVAWTDPDPNPDVEVLDGGRP
jgi:hypothetical protein